MGYQLTIEKEHDPKEIQQQQEQAMQSPKHKAIVDIVTSAVPDATLLSDVGTEISYQLPMNSSANFPSMFEDLDRQIDSNNVSSYGVSITTLDEVFLLVARGDHIVSGKGGDKQKHGFASSKQSLTSSTDKDSSNNEEVTKALLDDINSNHSARSSSNTRMKLEDDGLFQRHLYALFYKRAQNFRRDKKAWICITIVPSVFVALGFVIFSVVAPVRDMMPIDLDFEQYNPDVRNTISQPRNPIAVNDIVNDFTC